MVMTKLGSFIGGKMIARLPDRQPFLDYVPRRKSPLDAEKYADHASFAVQSDDLATARNDHLGMVDTINNAARAINDLAHRNDLLRKSADEKISQLTSELRAEKERSERMRHDLETLQAKHTTLLAHNEQRLRDLESERQDLSDRLQKVEEELDLSSQWLEYVSTHIRTQLNESVKKADSILRSKQSAA
jgi:hypothetical protein